MVAQQTGKLAVAVLVAVTIVAVGDVFEPLVPNMPESRVTYFNDPGGTFRVYERLSGTADWGMSAHGPRRQFMGGPGVIGHLADITGNGMDDAVIVNSEEDGFVIQYRETLQNGVMVEETLGIEGARWGDPTLGDIILFGDVDGDGIDDVIIYRSSTATWYYYASAGVGGLPDPAVVSLIEVDDGEEDFGDEDSIPLVADINGDGYLDRILVEADGAQWLVSVAFSTGHGFAWDGAIGSTKTLGDVENSYVSTSDINGNGFDDLVLAYFENWEWVLSGWYSSSDGLSTSETPDIGSSDNDINVPPGTDPSDYVWLFGRLDPGPTVWYDLGDINQDRTVDLDDFYLLIDDWLECTDPDNPQCIDTLPSHDVIVYHVPQAQVLPEIDGVIDSGEWDDALHVPMSYPEIIQSPNQGTAFGPASPPSSHDDLSADWYFKWDEDYFYFACRVYDDDLIFTATPTGEAGLTHQDTIQMGFIFNNDPNYLKDFPDADSLRPIHDFAPETGFGTGAYMVARVDRLPNVLFDGSVQTDGFTIEGALAWRDFGYIYTPRPGDLHRILLILLDWDRYEMFGQLIPRHKFLLDSGQGDQEIFGKYDKWNRILLVESTGGCGSQGRLRGDIDGDCFVDLNDLSVMASDWLKE